MIHDSADEYQNQVLLCALALKTLKDSDKIRGLSIAAEDNNVEFVEDVNMAYKALLADEEAEQETEQVETDDDDEDDVLEAITFTLKLLSAATAKIIETQAVHDKAIKTLLQGKL